MLQPVSCHLAVGVVNGARVPIFFALFRAVKELTWPRSLNFLRTGDGVFVQIVTHAPTPAEAERAVQAIATKCEVERAVQAIATKCGGTVHQG